MHDASGSSVGETPSLLFSASALSWRACRPEGERLSQYAKWSPSLALTDFLVRGLEERRSTLFFRHPKQAGT